MRIGASESPSTRSHSGLELGCNFKYVDRRHLLWWSLRNVRDGRRPLITQSLEEDCGGRLDADSVPSLQVLS